MHTTLAPYILDFQATGHLSNDVQQFLAQHGNHHTYSHQQQVAAKAAQLATQFNGNSNNCQTAAWLHDISAIIPNQERIAVAQALGIEVLPEEASFPMIIHQKLSAVIAQEVFNINDPDILNAIQCHTTLKAYPSRTDLILFVADKIAWDQAGTPPYLPQLNQALHRSLETAALAYLNYLWSIRHKLRVLHPWAVAARQYLMQA